MTIVSIILSIISLALLIAVLSVYRQWQRSESSLRANGEITASLRERAAAFETRALLAERQLIDMRALQNKMNEAANEQQMQLIEQSENRFRLLANELLSSHSQRMTRVNEESMLHLLNPLKEDIDRFRRDVTNFYGKESAERFSLQERIKELIETNNNIGREARELATALRGNSKIQGDWGELILERILENSGLREGEEFEVQKQRDDNGKTLRSENGHSLRPDVVVKYPGGKVMVIDSKVSLTAFVEYVNSENDDDRERYGKLHLTSVMKHISELSEKNYQDYVGDQKLDFVMMFIPNESAYSAAMTLDPSLWQKAYEKRVLVVSPTQLVASLKIVQQLWSHDRQTRNAIDIAQRSGAMYDKFVGFVTDMERIERSLTATRTAYDAAMRKLRDGTGSLIGRAEKLREMGVKTSKRLPKSDADEE